MGTRISGREVHAHGEERPPWLFVTTRNYADDVSPEQLIFPTPQEIAGSGSDFVFDDDVFLVLPIDASDGDVHLATFLAHELADQWRLFVKTERLAKIPAGGKLIVMGTLDNALVRSCCSEAGLMEKVESLPAEGYVLHTDRRLVLIAARDGRGAFYGLQSLRQLVRGRDLERRVRGVSIRDWPDKPFRGIYLFVPGRNHIPFFKRFVRDFMGLYKFNTLVMEMNACMRLDCHPELNAGWVEFARDVNYSARNYPLHPIHEMEQNSSHQDAGDGGILEKEEVADLAAWVRLHQIEFVPSLPSFTHSYYLLTGHRELAAVPEDKWPDIYCPSNPKSYDLVFEVYAEYLEVLKPKSVHIGHDELFVPIGTSLHCKDKNIGELFGEDVRAIHNYLARKGVATQLWGDMLLESVRGRGPKMKRAPDGWRYSTPGGLTPEQVQRLIPKDCLIYNWFWKNEPGQRVSAEANEAELDRMGFRQIFGNLEPVIEDYAKRKKLATLLGGAASAWFATNEVGFGKDLMATFLGCSNTLWTGQVIDGKALAGLVQSLLPTIRAALSGITPPSRTEDVVVPIDISNRFNAGDSLAIAKLDLSELAAASVAYKKMRFDLRSANGMRAIVVGTEGRNKTGLPHGVDGISVAEAPTSLIFLHAAARPALNRESYRLIWDQEDTADLLGWYEVVYEDGLVIPVPIRYGVNILEWNWDERVSANDYCYGADAVEVGKRVRERVTFFAYEWINPRLGKVIREVRIKGSSGFQGGSADYDNEVGPVIASNAVMLVAMSMVKRRG